MRGTTGYVLASDFSNIISIHVPREGDDFRSDERSTAFGRFQSTSPVRGTTLPLALPFSASIFQSTSPVRGTTRLLTCLLLFTVISIHVPREGDDPFGITGRINVSGFQSTSPVRGTTPLALLAVSMFLDFNPRPP